MAGLSRDISIRLATVEQLVEELGRKLNANDVAEAPEQWCDECRHFSVSPGATALRDNSNPCRKKHRMKFYVPQPHDSPETFGYFMPVCKDREARV